jgi:hypothetical protein
MRWLDDIVVDFVKMQINMKKSIIVCIALCNMLLIIDDDDNDDDD